MAQETITFATSTSLNQLYSNPELIDTRVYQDRIELVYRRQYIASNNWGLPDPEIYAEVYSRTDGSMRVVKGRYVAAQPESYLLEE
jgi:hypothetical protein